MKLETRFLTAGRTGLYDDVEVTATLKASATGIDLWVSVAPWVPVGTVDLLSGECDEMYFPWGTDQDTIRGRYIQMVRDLYEALRIARPDLKLQAYA